MNGNGEGMAQDLGGQDIFGSVDMNEFARIQAELRKSMDVQYPVPGYTGGGVGAPLMPQSIENSLAWATLQNKHIKLWDRVPKPGDRLTSTVHEFTRQDDIGPDLEGWAPEGVVGPSVDSDLTRLFQKVRYLSHIREVTDAASQVSILGPSPNMVAKVTADATLFMLKMVEWSLFFGDSAINPHSIDGLYASCSGVGNVYDNRGAAISPQLLYDISASLIDPPIYGFPDTVWMPVKVQTDLSKIGGDYLRYPGFRPGDTNGEVKVGLRASSLIGPMGDIGFEPSVFLAPTGGPASVAVGEDAPSPPTVAAVAGAVGAETSLFTADDAGIYKYKVVACGAKGRSAPWTSGNITVAAGQKVTVTVTAPGTDNVLYYIVYRKKVGGSDFYEITRLRQTYSGGAVANTVYVDVNRYLPDTSKVFIVQTTPDVMQWRQLLDFARIPLAKTRLTQPYAFTLYGMFLSQIPKRLYCIENVGRLS